MIGIRISALAHQPTRRFWAEPDLGHDDQGWHTGACDHKSPVQPGNVRWIGNIQENEVGDVAEHDPESSPHLPHHDESTANGRRGAFCRVHRNSRRLRADTDPKDESSGEQVLP